MRRSFQVGRNIALAGFLIGLMMVEWLRRIEFSNATIQNLQKDLIDAALSKSTQIAIFIALLIYFVGLLWIVVGKRRRKGIAVGFWKGWMAIDMCKIGLAIFSLVAYLPSWKNGAELGSVNNLQFGIDQTTNGLVLLIGLVTGCAAEWLVGLEVESNRKVRDVVLLAIPVFLAATSFAHPEIPHLYKYHDVIRWTGLWVNPNTYGLLMGGGVILAIGLFVLGIRYRVSRPGRIYRGLASIVIILCGHGLFKSYSRGAWLATMIGAGYLMYQMLGVGCQASGVAKTKSDKRKAEIWWPMRNWRPLSVVVLSVLVLTFWQFRFTEWRPARRAFSVANANDFSWRNRVEAWKGALRMMSDRPFIGFGWGEADSVYEKKFSPPQVDSGFAILTNDYFMLGISAGVPALVCFVMYVGLSLRGSGAGCQASGGVGIRNVKRRMGTSEIEDRQDVSATLDSGLCTFDWLQAVCRAGAIVLLVGFWFDGGLFKLATGSVFWILLELGRVEPRRSADLPIGTKQFPSAKLAEREFGARADGVQGTAAPYQRSRLEIWLRRVAWVVAAVALTETAVCVGTPFLAVNNGTLAIARKLLIPLKAVGDLDFLATNASWNGNKLKILIEHASLANYNRELINWKLDDQIYREFVLWPDLDRSAGFQHGGAGATSDRAAPGKETGAPALADLAWRRLLWEYFYPSIRKQNDPQSAADIVLKKMCERVKIVEKAPPTIGEMWRQQIADVVGFGRIYVAVLRSIGIPARLNADGHSELFADGKWQPAPQPIISDFLPNHQN